MGEAQHELLEPGVHLLQWAKQHYNYLYHKIYIYLQVKKKNEMKIYINKKYYFANCHACHCTCLGVCPALSTTESTPCARLT